MSGEGGPIPSAALGPPSFITETPGIKWHTGHAITREGEIVDWTPKQEGDTTYWYPSQPSEWSGRIDVMWGSDWIIGYDEEAYQAWEAKQRTWQYRLRSKLRQWWDTIDAIWPCEISQWIARQLRRYADWIDERSWYI